METSTLHHSIPAVAITLRISVIVTGCFGLS